MIKKKELLTYIYINTSDDLKTEVWVIKVWSKKTLGSDDIFVKKYEELDPKSHLKFLVPLIKKALDENSIKFSDLDFIALNEGPGSWTGLRIGASTVKVLCFVNDLPLISVNNFEIMKKAQNYKQGMYLVRCSSVNFYYSKVIPNKTEDGIISEGEVFMSGENSDKFYLSEFSPHFLHSLISEKYHSSNFSNVDSFEPFYVSQGNILSNFKTAKK